jgi:uroporphyrin-III C-methyltransferase/precorrin-2 dehydrogenase/sirohydrochlorin ferrochelatase
MLIKLKPKKVLLIGGGVVAKQKADVLTKQNIPFDIVTLKNNTPYPAKIKEFEISDTNGYDVVIDATGCDKVTNTLLENKNFLLNVVDKPEVCDFYFGSIAKKGDISVLVSSNGKSPRLTQVIRDRIEKILPNNFEIDRKKDYETIKNETSKVFIIGCGPGAVDLLTIRAYNTLKTLDVALYDHLVNPEVLDILPQNCEKIYVGKQKGYHHKKQDEINELLVQKAKEGKIVGRLKGGHPFVFGRGYEEMIELTNEGIEVEIIEGLTSAISAPTEALIPVTLRDKKDSFMVVSAHLKGARVNLNWVDLLHRENLRVIVLMGLSRAKNIQKRALEIGINENREVYIISNATTSSKILKTTLKNLEKKAKEVKKPAIIIF